MSTSDVFRKKLGDAQADAGISFVQNFGWAPQHCQSRARPYARESRRWDAMWSVVVVEVVGSNPDRRQLAVHFLESLGGQHSIRLLLGGLLADLSAEHFSLLATGGLANPDATTGMARSASFHNRHDVLFLQIHIFKLQGSYTGVTLEFLKRTH